MKEKSKVTIKEVYDKTNYDKQFLSINIRKQLE